MCTPQNLRDNCSCPYQTRRCLTIAGRVTAAVAGIAMVWWMFAAGYGWVFAVAAWLAVMGAVGLVVRRRTQTGAQSPLLVRRYIPGERDERSLVPVPGPVPAQEAHRSHARDAAAGRPVQ